MNSKKVIGIIAVLAVAAFVFVGAGAALEQNLKQIANTTDELEFSISDEMTVVSVAPVEEHKITASETSKKGLTNIFIRAAQYINNLYTGTAVEKVNSYVKSFITPKKTNDVVDSNTTQVIESTVEFMAPVDAEFTTVEETKYLGKRNTGSNILILENKNESNIKADPILGKTVSSYDEMEDSILAYQTKTDIRDDNVSNDKVFTGLKKASEKTDLYVSDFKQNEVEGSVKIAEFQESLKIPVVHENVAENMKIELNDGSARIVREEFEKESSMDVRTNESSRISEPTQSVGGKSNISADRYKGTNTMRGNQVKLNVTSINLADSLTKQCFVENKSD